MVDCSNSNNVKSPAIPSQNYTNGLSRHEKEMGIQIAEMEKYKWICSQDQGHDVGRLAYFEWTQKYGRKVREWLESLSDDEIDRLFSTLSDRIKNYILEKAH
ncbi:MAG: hypothetical protein M0R34_01745 [Candidatus Marinimicrobia bacterium]|nr:hypothetical protein [Candidatus Neomarinimicrobiota bacterium]MDD5061261.1 hypothetical protein [Candidatus Neomarinimicrobiota bacterium]MDD5539386.1 hypothetical protein [Candidatus Neomarinimicrobiota bacterium]